MELDTNTITTTKTQETSTLVLIDCVKNYFNGELKKKNSTKITMNCNTRNIDNVFKEIYKRHVIPFYIPILIILSLIHIIKSKEVINYNKYRILIFISGVLMIIFSETTLRFINDDVTFNLNMIFIPIIIFLFLYLIIYFQTKTTLSKNKL